MTLHSFLEFCCPSILNSKLGFTNNNKHQLKPNNEAESFKKN